MNSARGLIPVLVASVVLTIIGCVGTVTPSAEAAAGAAQTASPSPTGTTPDAVSSIWSVETTVNQQPKQVNNSFFDGVSASGPDEAWAVGIYGDENALDHPLAEHWNGSAWSLAQVPQPTGQQATFGAVADLGPDDTWAVGTSFSGGAGTTPGGSTLIEQWNGTRWAIVPSPNAVPVLNGNSNTLDAIAATGPDDIWAAGWYLNNDADLLTMLVEHWNGTSWSLVTSPIAEDAVVTSLTAISSDDVWAVGSFADDGNMSAHWNGRKWVLVATPNVTSAGTVAQNELTAVSSDSAHDVWASGYVFNVNDKNFAEPFVLHWNGSRWSLTMTPNIGSEGSRLRGINVASATDVWAVGQEQQDNGSILTLTEQYDGSTWKIFSSPDPGMNGTLVDNSLSAVDGAGGGNLFAVGADEMNGQCCLRTLAIGTSQG
ncbi:MAG TPA: hypothetical protein VEJ87_07305 [Acidimicrobiales bacterium]|nr:hypothetical protein [Acidimicrobiales bacterium]